MLLFVVCQCTHVLVVLGDADDLDLNAEESIIEACKAKAHSSRLVNICVCRSPTKQKLREYCGRLTCWNIFHFSGHCEQGSLLLGSGSNMQLDLLDLCEILAKQQHLRGVILNGCSTASLFSVCQNLGGTSGCVRGVLS